MSASTTTRATSPRWTIRHLIVLAAIVLAVAAGLFVAYTITSDAPTVSDTTGELAPVPFKDGFVPAQPM